VRGEGGSGKRGSIEKDIDGWERERKWGRYRRQGKRDGE
jgi:hypothetical protein